MPIADIHYHSRRFRSALPAPVPAVSTSHEKASWDCDKIGCGKSGCDVLVGKQLVPPAFGLPDGRSITPFPQLLTPETGREAFELIRRLIDAIILTPVDGKLEIELRGDLAGILAISEAGKAGTFSPKEKALQIKLVAGTRNRHYLLFRAEGLPVADVAYRKVKSPFPTRFLS